MNSERETVSRKVVGVPLQALRWVTALAGSRQQPSLQQWQYLPAVLCRHLRHTPPLMRPDSLNSSMLKRQRRACKLQLQAATTTTKKKTIIINTSSLVISYSINPVELRLILSINNKQNDKLGALLMRYHLIQSRLEGWEESILAGNHRTHNNSRIDAQWGGGGVQQLLTKRPNSTFIVTRSMYQAVYPSRASAGPRAALEQVHRVGKRPAGHMRNEVNTS